VADGDAAYREAMDAAVACIRDPEAGSQGIDTDRLKNAIVANAIEFHRLDALEKARLEFSIGASKHREDGKHLTAALPRIGIPESAGGNPRHRQDRKERH